MDKLTGLLWVNLNYFEYRKTENKGYTFVEAKAKIKDLQIEGYKNWKIPNKNQIIRMIDDKSFPFQSGANRRIKGYYLWFCHDELNNFKIDIDDYSMKDLGDASLLPCCDTLINNNYDNDISKDNKIYTEKEKLKFTLDIFVNNGLEPIFENHEITQLYRKIYIEKPLLLEKLNELQEQINGNELQEQINGIQKEVLLSSSFNYNDLIKKYDIESINNSLIKYYEAIKTWIDLLMDKIKYYESIKSEVIKECNIIGLALSKKYEESPNLTDEENMLLKQRQNYFKKHFEIGINDVNFKLLSIKRQAQDIEDRIDEINNGDNSIKELALLENESRASFRFIAENTANIIKSALTKIDYFEKNREFSALAVKVWNEWTEDYKVFKTAKKEELKNISQDDGIEKDIWERWYQDWNNTRFIIEKQLLPLIKRGLKGEIITNEVSSNNIESDNIIKNL